MKETHSSEAGMGGWGFFFGYQSGKVLSDWQGQQKNYYLSIKSASSRVVVWTQLARISWRLRENPDKRGRNAEGEMGGDPPCWLSDGRSGRVNLSHRRSNPLFTNAIRKQKLSAHFLFNLFPTSASPLLCNQEGFTEPSKQSA